MGSPTPTFPLFLLTGEQGGQAVSPRRGFRLLQRAGKGGGVKKLGVCFRDRGPGSQGLREVVVRSLGEGVVLRTWEKIWGLCGNWGASMEILVGLVVVEVCQGVQIFGRRIWGTEGPWWGYRSAGCLGTKGGPSASSPPRHLALRRRVILSQLPQELEVVLLLLKLRHGLLAGPEPPLRLLQLLPQPRILLGQPPGLGSQPLLLRLQ